LTGSLRTARYFHTATLLSDGTVLVAAGFNAAVSYGLLASAERYSPSTGKWSSAGSLAVARRAAMAALLQDGRVLVAGGDGYGGFSSAEIFSPATNSWSSGGSMTGAHALATATRLNDGRVLIAGDSYRGDVYSPSTGTWSATGYMVYSNLQETAAALLGDGRVLLTGGYNSICDSTYEFCGPNLTHGAEIYSPS
jgi:N-acetylneuraminic acid mutarotase